MALKLHEWHFAANGVWEEALVIPAALPDLDVVEKWVRAQPQNIAFEGVFAKDGIPSTMFGVRLTPLDKDQQVERIKALVAESSNIKSEQDFEQILPKHLPNHPLFSTPLEALNIGIVGQWFSFGEHPVYTPQAGAVSLADFRNQAPRFFEPTQKPAAIEFWRTKPLDHWYKIYVSDFRDGAYYLNPDKYESVITKVRG